jgi:hypothetical protein
MYIGQRFQTEPRAIQWASVPWPQAQELSRVPRELSKMAGFFSDAWAMPTPLQEEGPSVGAHRTSDREKTAKWAPAHRFINVQGRKKMLMAILWCTEEELLLAKKFPFMPVAAFALDMKSTTLHFETPQLLQHAVMHP